MSSPVNTRNINTPSMTSGSTITDNPWDVINIPPNREFDQTGWIGATDRDEKFSFINNESAEGYCYIKLVYYVQAFIPMKIENFKKTVLKFKNCGKDPIANKMMVDFLVICMYELGVDSGQLTANSFSTSLINHLMSSKVRSKLTDNGKLHIEDERMEGCGCTDILCDHGWSARYIITVLSSSDKAVGATINFEDFNFDNEELGEDDQSTILPGVNRIGKSFRLPEVPPPPPPMNRTDTSELRTERKNTIRTAPQIMDTADKLSDIVDKLAGFQRKSERLVNDHVYGNKDNRRESEKLNEAMQSVQRELDEMIINEEVSELRPNDSSSNFGGRAERQGKYMRQGTIIGHNASRNNPYEVLPWEQTGHPTNLVRTQTGGSQLSVSRANQTLYTTGDLKADNQVRGYMKTNSMIEQERQMSESVAIINGLSSPFNSERLALLCHLHTGLHDFGIKINDAERLCRGLVEVLRRMPRSSSERLLYQVISLTFDIESMTVISNLFDMPYIEVGMRVSGALLSKSFTMLAMEYEMLWFQEMKNLRVPEFHSRYHTVSERDPNTASKSKFGAEKHSRNHKEKPKRRGSLLEYMTT